MSSHTECVAAFITTSTFFTDVHYSEPIFGGPFKRAELLRLPQYAASDAFPAAGKWTGSKDHLLSVKSGKDGETTEALYCIVVGTISADRAYLAKHGNFSTKFSDGAQKAKLQFSVTRPNDPDFGNDYDKAVVAFQECLRAVSETPDQRYFLLKEAGNAMRMNFGLFKPKVSHSKCC
jgi:hypothetical protein